MILNAGKYVSLKALSLRKSRVQKKVLIINKKAHGKKKEVLYTNKLWNEYSPRILLRKYYMYLQLDIEGTQA